MEKLKLYNLDGSPYRGHYFFEKGKYFSGLEFNLERNRLLTQKEANPIIVRKQIPIKGDGYVPVKYTPVLTEHSYTVLKFTRYFVQKINRPYGTITEISVEDYNIGLFQYETSPTTGLYQGCSLYWYILGNEYEVEANNRKAVSNISDKYPKFLGLDLHIVDYLEFYKKI